MEKEKVICLYEDIFYNEDFHLTLSEKIVLSIYKYYTKNGKYKCCSLTNEEVAKKANISKRHIKRIKTHLNELGLIRTSGIKVYYEGMVKEYQNGTSTGTNLSPHRYQNGTSTGTKMVLHNKENKESIEPPYKGSIDSENKEENESSVGLIEETNLDSLSNEENKLKTNWQLVLDKLPNEYKTTDALDEYKKLIKKKYNIEYDASVDKFNSIKNIDSNTIKTYRKQIMITLNVYVNEKRLKENQHITKDKEEKHTGIMLI